MTTTALDLNVPLFSCPAPEWANQPTESWNGTVEYSRYAERPLMVSAWLQQFDALDVISGVVTLVRLPATIMVKFDGVGDTAHDSDLHPIDQWRGGWMPELPEHIAAERIELAREAVAELRDVFDRLR